MFTTYGVTVAVTCPRDLAPRVLNRAPIDWAPAREIDASMKIVVADGVLGDRVLLDEERRVLGRSDRDDEIIGYVDQSVMAHVGTLAPSHVFSLGAVVGCDAGAILITGGTLSGTTTLASALVAAGATAVSDDFAVLDMHGRAVPFSRHAVKSLDRDASAPVVVKPLRVAAVVLASYQPGAHWHTQELSRGEGALKLFGYCLAAGGRPDFAMRILRQALDDAVILAGERGPADATADAILDRVCGRNLPGAINARGGAATKR